MRRIDQINVIPLIDVMLVLLAVVLVTASFIVHDKLNIELPQTQQSASTAPLPETRHLALDAQGRLYFEAQPIALSQLSALLHADPKRPLELRVDRRTAFGDFVAVVERIKSLTPPPPLTILTEHVQP
ncbi:biopolymer transport protein ExbD [Sulfurivirga caldicuralii]|uniref:Biopolymer transport protein ExbD n=1 Tax=Sulfurivirga caldicuralii TaxID=364032 RepID=A0A1N6ELC1_9GAMM|nr:biopolymer transporter ExbD [Sulfurivirga caldicuralii]SIN83757.1 biopolymer transport protein ExbD [Sulfurivirga caldicuralii]